MPANRPTRADQPAAVAEEFGARLRRHREAAGLTQEELAERAGLSVKAIAALERGRRQRPYPHTVRALADALGLSDDERAAFSGALPSRERQTARPVAQRQALPLAPTALIGRERELRELMDLLAADVVRLVTLTGAGGVGKTRLALEVATQLQEAYAGRVAFVSLAPLADPGLVLPEVAQTLGLTEGGQGAIRDVLTAHFGSDRWLLVLDNAEHLLDAAMELAQLPAVCPGLALLVTSRAPLRLRAEHEYPVRPLALPTLGHDTPLEDIAQVEAVRLFVERARAASPAFALTPSNSAAVASICRRLDGLPLAIELVAARVRALSPNELLTRLDMLLPLLVGGARDLPERQQTMSAAINWSYQLLGPQAQTLFRRLSIFAGGWTLDAAEAVTSGEGLAEQEVLELLTELVEQSLVVAETDEDGSSRFRLLEPIRQFAAQRVQEAGEYGRLRDAHLAWYLAMAEQAAGELRGPAQHYWLARLEREHDNLRSALAWGQGDAARLTDGFRLAAALGRFWHMRGHLSEGRRWLDAALASDAAVAPAVRAEALNAAGNLARDQGDLATSQALHETALALRRELGDLRGVGISLNNVGTVLMDRGQFEQAAQMYEEVLALFRVHASDWEVALALHNLGVVLGNRGEYDRSEQYFEEALHLQQKLNETQSRARSLDARGEVARLRGDLDRAAALHQESLALRRAIGDTRGTALSLNNLGLVARYRGEYVEAERLIEEALHLRRQIGDKLATGPAIALADLARLRGETQLATQLYREAIEVRHRLGITGRLPECLLGMAALACDAGNAARAARLLAASDTLREQSGIVLSPVEQPEYDQISSAVRASLSPEDYAQQHAIGRSMSLDQAVAEALGE